LPSWLNFVRKINVKHKSTHTLALLLFLTSLLRAQPCQYLAYDGFDYPAGLPLHGLSGGSGWANPWEVQVADQSIPGYQTQSGGSLFWPGLQAPGTALGGGKAYLTAGRLLNTDSDGVFADFVGDNGEFVGDKKGTVLWMSALVPKGKEQQQRCLYRTSRQQYSLVRQLYIGQGGNRIFRCQLGGKRRKTLDAQVGGSVFHVAGSGFNRTSSLFSDKYRFQ
jgi:hypothetical protein